MDIHGLYDGTSKYEDLTEHVSVCAILCAGVNIGKMGQPLKKWNSFQMRCNNLFHDERVVKIHITATVKISKWGLQIC